jgi:putative phosphate-binding protein
MTMKLSTILTACALLSAMGIGLGSCTSDSKKPTSTSTSGIATIACDASFENILSQEIDVFEYIYPQANIIPYYVDESAAFDSLLNFSTKMIIATRTLNQKELDFMKSHDKNVRQSQIAVDALALIVNPDNPIEQMSKQELREILSGKVTRWDEVSPSHLGEIAVVFDHQGSSAAHYMRDSLLNGEPFGPNVFAQKTPEAVFEAVTKNKNAIGIIGVSWISSDMNERARSREETIKAVEDNEQVENTFTSAVKVLPVSDDDEVRAYKPYQAYIFEGKYPLYRQIYMITATAGGTLTHGFYSFVTSYRGQKIIQLTGVLPRVVQLATAAQVN